MDTCLTMEYFIFNVSHLPATKNAGRCQSSDPHSELPNSSNQSCCCVMVRSWFGRSGGGGWWHFMLETSKTCLPTTLSIHVKLRCVPQKFLVLTGSGCVYMILHILYLALEFILWGCPDPVLPNMEGVLPKKNAACLGWTIDPQEVFAWMSSENHEALVHPVDERNPANHLGCIKPCK